MKALLDTHVFLWWIMDDARLTPYIRDFIADEGNDLFLSSACCWEIAIKMKMGRLKLPDNPEKFIPDQMIANNISGLPIQLVHALHVYNLPDHHRDPFDRILVSQSRIEKIPIITNDQLFADYDVKVLWDKKRRRH
ncbi:MAG: type II toxin-antitoxin system VapC family toxin [Nitrospinae bacterium]|nr:type II toxin-antitoxin system VapC family toxin [Nitrospinota bacterium]